MGAQDVHGVPEIIPAAHDAAPRRMGSSGLEYDIDVLGRAIALLRHQFAWTEDDSMAKLVLELMDVRDHLFRMSSGTGEAIPTITLPDGTEG